jgi:hypothetical protein
MRLSVIASEAKQSRGNAEELDCFVAALLAMTEGVMRGLDPRIHRGATHTAVILRSRALARRLEG